MDVVVEDDPVPIVRIIGATVRRSARDPKRAAAMARARGVGALRSTTTPQAVSLRFGSGQVLVVRGVAPDAKVVIEADLDRMAEPDAPKPKVTGALGHLRLALALSKALDPPLGTWQEEANAFWAFASGHPGMPAGLRVVCADDGTELVLGARPAECELHGTAHRLRNAFAGQTLLGQDVFDGKLAVAGRLRHLAILTNRSLAWMFGGEPS